MSAGPGQWAPSPTVHASCVLVGETGILIRGPSGSGKSTLALSLMLDPPRALPAARLVADDRVHLTPAPDGLVAHAPATLAGLMEVRYLGIRRFPFAARARLGLVIDLAAEDAARMPEVPGSVANLDGFQLPRLAIPPGMSPRLLVAAVLTGKNP
ncbi:HPr kinase/phosphatase C-terminal domain-containing protein [Aquabacter sp. L1I39]|uniref:HPr kinase/phosphorylase n=1 Tax=Aquabacter sp. L1I39 TaxID=2820278 RepID=UPI001ADAD23B|nr:HPr kinase/phosphatase C-terminal domain-containing protein [Aquabacter sp. L1I39]QTL04360.1 HPr kinase/phosphatase C-terminal domain-containing protein [Aquabacter sp. L1I39]